MHEYNYIPSLTDVQMLLGKPMKPMIFNLPIIYNNYVLDTNWSWVSSIFNYEIVNDLIYVLSCHARL